jgi:hypothetical protein
MSTRAPKSPRLDATRVRAQIDALRAAHPEIWEDDDLTADMLEGETDLWPLLAEVVERVEHAVGMQRSLADRIADLKARKDRFARREEVMRGLAMRLMNIAEVRKVELTEATLSIRQGARKVIITNEKELPLPCVRIKREPDKLAIRGYMQQHGSCPGAELSNAEDVLTVGTK